MNSKITVKLATIVSRMFFTSTSTTASSVDVDNFQPIVVLNVFKTILIAGVSIWGSILVIKSIGELGPAIEQRDSATIANAIKGIFGGAIMAFIGPLLALLGFIY